MSSGLLQKNTPNKRPFDGSCRLHALLCIFVLDLVTVDGIRDHDDVP